MYETLKEHKEFQQQYNRALKKHSNSFILFFTKGVKTKVGFTASKKVGNAIKRNRAKRRLRAIFAEFFPLLKTGTYVFIAKEALHDFSYTELKRDMKYVSKKLHVLDEHLQ